MIRALALLPLLISTAAHAELTLCNRTSYMVETAIGTEKQQTVSTRGWFRIDPGQCRQVIEGALENELIYIHARTPAVYGSAPLPQSGHADLCINDRDFTL